MEAMYQEYKDIVEFRLIYIREAHSADGERPTQFAKDKGIVQQQTYDQRCTTAKMLFDENKLTIPGLVDSMDNKTNTEYFAHPDRVFLVLKDGTLAVAGAKGPRGFQPAIDDVEKWLIDYRKTLAEPASENPIDEQPQENPPSPDRSSSIR